MIIIESINPQKLSASTDLIHAIKYRYLIDSRTLTIRTSQMKMSYIIKVFLDKSKEFKLNANDARVLEVLAYRMNNGINCYPSYKYLLEKTKIGSKSTLSKSLKKLSSLKILVINKRPNDSNEYIFDKIFIHNCMNLINSRVQKCTTAVHLVYHGGTQGVPYKKINKDINKRPILEEARAVVQKAMTEKSTNVSPLHPDYKPVNGST